MKLVVLAEVLPEEVKKTVYQMVSAKPKQVLSRKTFWRMAEELAKSLAKSKAFEDAVFRGTMNVYKAARLALRKELGLRVPRRYMRRLVLEATKRICYGR